MKTRNHLASLTLAILSATLLLPSVLEAQGSRSARHPGSAILRGATGTGEALIPIECDVPSKPEAGFITEPSRITRRETGRTSMGSVRLRPWQDTGDVLITTSFGVAWVPAPTSSGGILTMELDVGPAGFERDGMPVAVTYDMWKAGEAPPERTTVYFEANCNTRDPAAPAWKKIDGS